MKKIILLWLVVFTVSIHAQGQFEKGSYLLGGTFSFSWQRTATNALNYPVTPDIRQLTATESPQFGIFVANNFALGAGVSFLQSRLSGIPTYYYNGTPNYEIRHYTGYTVTPFARYYISKVFIHINYDVGYGYQSGEDNGQAIPDKRSKVHGVKTGVGYAILLNPHVAIEPFFGYAYTRNDNNNDKIEYKINTLFLQVGIQVYLSKKK